ncbi:hypothetical protein IOQ59_00085 [Pontibacterium sp. N1Y112]|uniref:Uncharacterized protein n=1 Tax=Pontibacterium sinense TaxID=2781979 RepID=A0A8J7K8I5_9GAMM|nr:hypothetical protein [Pontibacterium sinense]MBE9395656.1 hypothetical protein [Pontibacterium sinense]
MTSQSTIIAEQRFDMETIGVPKHLAPNKETRVLQYVIQCTAEETLLSPVTETGNTSKKRFSLEKIVLAVKKLLLEGNQPSSARAILRGNQEMANNDYGFVAAALRWLELLKAYGDEAYPNLSTATPGQDPEEKLKEIRKILVRGETLQSGQIRQ